MFFAKSFIFTKSFEMWEIHYVVHFLNYVLLFWFFFDVPSESLYLNIKKENALVVMP